MNKSTIMLAFSLALLIQGCQPDPKPLTATKPKELADPELTISGVPASSVESGGTFTFSVSSKSEGAITVSVNKPAFAVAKAIGDGQYEVTAASPENVKVTVSAAQLSTSKFASASASASFSVTGYGSVAAPGPGDDVQGSAVTYEELSGNFARNLANPERGLYIGYEVRSNTAPLEAGVVSSKRTSTGHTLWLLEFYLTDFMGSSISDEFIEKMEDCFDGVRGGGAKAIVRFAYRDNNNNPNEDKEPALKQILSHINQVTPILRKNEDILLVLQAGFIGTWGEWYYTTNVSSLQDRKKVCDALLESVPASRQVQLRTPAYKMNMYGLALKDTITAATAHDGSVVSRLAGHNDCFGADKNDEGTFADETTRKYWKAETRYVIMGGETCKVSDYCLCEQTLDDLEDYHWTYLHDGYRQEVLDRWKTDGCFDEIQTRLGYRLVLNDVHYDDIHAGQPCRVTVRFENKGYAAPMNPREAWLVWVGSDGKKVKSFLGADARTWQPGYNAVVSQFTPSTDKGTLYLELSDPLIPGKPAYSIAFSNKDVFDSKTGYNKLFELK